MEKYIYSFNEGDKDMRRIMGGKGANLAEMTKIGLPVPSGFTVTTAVCDIFYSNNEIIPDNIVDEIHIAVSELEAMSNKTLGSKENPLLLSVRSGAVASMPGMMDTVLNIGLNDEVVNHLASISSNPRYVYDSYRRFIAMYGDVAENIHRNLFEDELQKYKKEHNIATDQDLTVLDLINIIKIFKTVYAKHAGHEFTQDPHVHLIKVIANVFKSWYNPRAIEYRKINNIGDDIKTAVNVQEMVYGNMNEQSATGVIFSRDPSTGEDKLYGEFLFNAQGEDIVAGVRTPIPIEKLESFMPHLYEELYGYAKKLEKHFTEMQDIEFTIENGKLFVLQTRTGKRSGIASIVIGLDMLKEGLIDEQTLIKRVSANDLKMAMHAQFDPEDLKDAKELWTGLSASPGVASGKIFFTSEELAESDEKHKVLIRLETSADDIVGMKLSDAIVTGRGGMTSHAAVVARGMGKVSVTGCEQIIIDEKGKTITLPDGTTLKEHDEISVDGTNGIVYAGVLKQTETDLHEGFGELLKLVDKYQTKDIKANGETIDDIKVALEYGATGIGLCRTEHMLFEEERLSLFRQLTIDSSNESVIRRLEELHQADFEALFMLLDGKTITVRYLDPPFHEFMPKTTADVDELAKKLGMTSEDVNRKIGNLHEENPMMGNRGSRLLLTNQAILKMQTTAIARALKAVQAKGINPVVEVMIPLISTYNEAVILKQVVDTVLKQENVKLLVGIMIETPRSALIAHHLAPLFDFYSFGTNDLTQYTYGISRDDSNKFMPDYIESKAILTDPFITIDEVGVGTLVKTAVNNARAVKPNLLIGVCGEHAGDADSVEFFTTVAIDYLSASPYRIPIVKLVIAKASLNEE